MSDKTVIGTTKVSSRWRMSLVDDVRELFESQGRPVEIGDTIVYRRVDGEVVVEPAEGPDHQ